MGLEMVLNDLSLLPLAENIYAARRRMSNLVAMLGVVGALKIEKALRTEVDIHQVELTHEYPIARWLNDPDVDKEARRYFRSFATRSPYLREVNDSQILDTYYASDFFYGERKAVGLGIAYLLDALAISFHSHSTWEESSLSIRQEQLLEDVEDTIVEYLVSIRHACMGEHILQHRDWILQRVRVHVESGIDLCRQCETLYPRLQFCPSALGQIQDLPRGEIHLRQIMKHLQDLNDYCMTWETGPFSKKNIPGKIWEESTATLDKYAEEHTFVTPGGERRKFSWHCRIAPAPWRIYFLPLEREHLIIIGHIGEHLPTVIFHT